MTVGWRVIEFAFVDLPARLLSAPAMFKGVRQHLSFHRWHQLPPRDSASPQPALELSAPTDDRGEYIQVIRRRGELMVEMDRLKVKEAELAQRLGGPDEAQKLLGLPGKKL